MRANFLMGTGIFFLLASIVFAWSGSNYCIEKCWEETHDFPHLYEACMDNCVGYNPEDLPGSKAESCEGACNAAYSGCKAACVAGMKGAECYEKCDRTRLVCIEKCSK